MGAGGIVRPQRRELFRPRQRFPRLAVLEVENRQRPEDPGIARLEVVGRPKLPRGVRSAVEMLEDQRVVVAHARAPRHEPHRARQMVGRFREALHLR